MGRITGTIVLIWALVPALLQAREQVCLKSGFCLEVQSHMISDDMLVVQSGQGTLVFPVDQVERILALPTVIEPPTARTSLIAGQPGSSNSAANSEELLIRAAIQEGLEPEFVRSVAMVESGMNQSALSPKGALGLMQLMPTTAGRLGVDPTMAEQNALGGAAFLRQLLIKYNGDPTLALAAYNAGPGAVDKYKGVPPFVETRRYVAKVLQEYARQQKLEAAKNVQAAKAHPLKMAIPPPLKICVRSVSTSAAARLPSSSSL